MKYIRLVGSIFLNLASHIGNVLFFGIEAIIRGLRAPRYYSQFLDYLINTAVSSVLIVAVANFFIGMVLVTDGNNMFHANMAYLPTLVSQSIVSEIAPILTAIMYVGRVGVSMASDIANMKFSSRINAVKMLGVNPIKFFVSSRVCAAIIGFPVLIYCGIVSGLLGGYSVWTYALHRNAQVFISAARNTLTMHNGMVVVIKALIFGATISTIACYVGYHYANNSDSIGKPATQAMLQSVITVLLINYLLSLILY